MLPLNNGLDTLLRLLKLGELHRLLLDLLGQGRNLLLDALIQRWQKRLVHRLHLRGKTIQTLRQRGVRFRHLLRKLPLHFPGVSKRATGLPMR